MPPRLIAHISLLSLVFSIAVAVHAQPPKGDSDATTSQTLQAMEKAWLNSEKNNDTATFETIVADHWIAINPDGKRQTKAVSRLLLDCCPLSKIS